MHQVTSTAVILQMCTLTEPVIFELHVNLSVTACFGFACPTVRDPVWTVNLHCEDSPTCREILTSTESLRHDSIVLHKVNMQTTRDDRKTTRITAGIEKDEPRTMDEWSADCRAGRDPCRSSAVFRCKNKTSSKTALSHRGDRANDATSLLDMKSEWFL